MLYHHLYLGEHAIRSAKWERGASQPTAAVGGICGGWRLASGIARWWVEGEERSPAAVGRAEGDRRAEGGKGIGGEEIGTGREGSVFISSRSFF
jgi:hypothetical protein